MIRIDFNRLRFLVIDDNAHMRRILRTLLHGFGTREVYEAEDGAAGLEAFTHYMPDIVITDWAMPIFDGLELTQMIRQPGANANPYVPIIMLTGHSEKKRVISARDAGVTEFLAKPISAKALYQRILNVVANPRPFIRTKTYFGPDRRATSTPTMSGPSGARAARPTSSGSSRCSTRRKSPAEKGDECTWPRKETTAVGHHLWRPRGDPAAEQAAQGGGQGVAGKGADDDPVARAEAALAELSGEFSVLDGHRMRAPRRRRAARSRRSGFVNADPARSCSAPPTTSRARPRPSAFRVAGASPTACAG